VVVAAPPPGGAAGTEKASTSPDERGFGTRLWRMASRTGHACFSFGFSRPSAIGRRASALNMLALGGGAEDHDLVAVP
jgi:hypothetical protein